MIVNSRDKRDKFHSHNFARVKQRRFISQTAKTGRSLRILLDKAATLFEHRQNQHFAFDALFTLDRIMDK